ncbi:26S proteasome regulatory subunit 4 [Desmophyllum pertusum]|uniref:26S proteasome regulatory subunit 4 n=1 Tax=Desmophyllum pertusum TaxID=174260 RepID=A0A9W9YKQ9_9CNID|nr:26S proteasome regulatory subunit 4 [Desmophyllum pertusum]
MATPEEKNTGESPSLTSQLDVPLILVPGHFVPSSDVHEQYPVEPQHCTRALLPSALHLGRKAPMRIGYESNSGGEREIQRTMLELLNQLDGFDSKGDVKVVMATNRIETLDPALIRPGRIDRKIEFPLPDEKTKRRIFTIHTGRMTLSEDVNLEEYVMAKDDLSGADIKAICTEAGLMALRERRMKVTNEDFRKSKENVLYRKNEGTPEGLYF